MKKVNINLRQKMADLRRKYTSHKLIILRVFETGRLRRGWHTKHAGASPSKYILVIRTLLCSCIKYTNKMTR